MLYDTVGVLITLIKVISTPTVSYNTPLVWYAHFNFYSDGCVISTRYVQYVFGAPLQWLFNLYIGETYLFVQLLMSERRSEGIQIDSWLLTSFKHHNTKFNMLRVETLVETGVYIVALCTTPISGIYI